MNDQIDASTTPDRPQADCGARATANRGTTGGVVATDTNGATNATTGTDVPGAQQGSSTAPGDPSPAYNPVAPQIDLIAMEHEILRLWAEHGTFEATLAKPAPQGSWTFYEGPPTANGRPGTHHIEARAFKDVFPRFKTMQGFRVPRKAGWDCHGLPVEIAVEKELGFAGKPDIERYGIKEFNEHCRASVGQHIELWRELTTRMGYWVNLDDAYQTMSTPYVQSVWWALKQIHEKGLLVEDYRVAPYCPRCGTTLSDHELAQGYEEDEVTTVFVRLPLTSGPWADKAALLAWTTTPWTLIANTAAAVNPGVEYVAASNGQETLIVAAALRESVLGDDYQVVASFTGQEMERWHYRRPFEVTPLPGEANYVILGDFVTTEDGTGVVHEAPAFGEIDMLACRAYGLPLVNPILPDGSFEAGLELVGGMFFQSADQPIIESLGERGLLFRSLDITHQYPHCWRCDTALIYYAQPSWYIRTTAIKEQLLRENESTNWFPEHIKHGRFGNWLENNIDWALSRSRYWGTPLPIWRCESGHQVCVGSLEELTQLTGQDQSGLDPHRPFVDEISFACPHVDQSGEICGQPSWRVPEVIDAWFDSGSMPFAQRGYPWQADSTEALQDSFPADFICEAIDQTRGWFYSLMAVSTLVFGQNSYRNVLCLGHILAEDGRKMSKHLGNILEPMPLLDQHGADAVRWFMVAGGSPWSSRRVGHAIIQETVRKVLLTYWNSVSFQALYARVNHWTPGAAPAVAQRHVLDRWLVSRTASLTHQVTEALEAFDTLRAGSLIQEFVDELSNWYVRRSRRRFWAGDNSALSTLHETLDVLTRLMAPIAPFITERVWQDLFVASGVTISTGDVARSVHLASWPSVDPTVIDEPLEQAMELTRRLVELCRSARSEASMKIRQPLSRALVASSSLSRLTPELIDEIRAELNIDRVESFADAGDLVDYTVKGNFRALGKRFGKQTAAVAAAVAAADPAQIAAAIAADGRVRIDWGDGIELSADEVVITERPRAGWSVVDGSGETVALDLTLTPELIAAGQVREFIRAVQEFRKTSGFDVSDRISLTWSGSGPVGEAIAAASTSIADEVLATSINRVDQASEDWAGDDELGVRFTASRV
ncbi:MAG: isoleucine--tRNA ligase [Propionibacteriaceae bacterium]|jgi:isoleucyl-tRNA synthetase|nr:isoleucine--tRNA ligase [Propionibacteriaceae bacterium]